MDGCRILIVVVVVAGLTVGGPAALRAVPVREEAREKDLREPAGRISSQVSALQVLYILKCTPEQLEALARIAKHTSPKARQRKALDVTERYRKALVDLRQALIDNEDDKIVELNDELASAQEKDKPELDDPSPIVDAARKHVPQALRVFTSRQIAGYVGSLGDEFPEPLERLKTAFDDVRGLTDEQWEKERKLLTTSLSWLIAGRHAEAGARVEKEVGALLDKVRGLSDDDYRKQGAELEGAARILVGDLEPIQVIRHYMERELADLLSNPELPAVLEARLKKIKSTKKDDK